MSPLFILNLKKNQVEESFQKMLCEAYGVDDEEDLPKEVQGIDIVKFAELSDATMSTIMVWIFKWLSLLIHVHHSCYFNFARTCFHAS